jgi:GTPase SAR1 family protein
VEDPESFENVQEKWFPEVRHFCPRAPVILVACKTDLREGLEIGESSTNQGQRIISKEEGEEMAKKIGASTYLECSAQKEEGVVEVVTTAAVFASFSPQPGPKVCIVI